MDGVCAVCLEGGADEEKGGWAVLSCGHGFHPACVGPWLAEQGSCPTCRADVGGGEEGGGGEGGDAERGERAIGRGKALLLTAYAASTAFCVAASLVRPSSLLTLVLAVASGTALLSPVVAIPSSLVYCQIAVFRAFLYSGQLSEVRWAVAAESLAHVLLAASCSDRRRLPTLRCPAPSDTSPLTPPTPPPPQSQPPGRGRPPS